MKKQSLFLALAISSTIPIFADQPAAKPETQSTLSRRPRVSPSEEILLTPDQQAQIMRMQQIQYYADLEVKASKALKTRVEALVMLVNLCNENSTKEEKESCNKICISLLTLGKILAEKITDETQNEMMEQ